MPYQLHCCCAHAIAELDDPIDDPIEDELPTEDDDGRDDDDTTGTEDGAEDEAGVPEQTVPFMVGISAVAPFLFNWKPKLALWPGGSVPFQFRLLAVYGLLPETVAFHEPLKRLVAYCQFTDQPLIVALVELVTLMVPVAPVFHSLSIV